MTIEKKAWYKSKTKWAVLTGTVASVLTIVSGILSGNINLLDGIKALLIPITIILAVFGFRDLNIFNKK